jgi:cobalamin biosynthesis Mg chelatase CobN
MRETGPARFSPATPTAEPVRSAQPEPSTPAARELAPAQPIATAASTESSESSGSSTSATGAPQRSSPSSASDTRSILPNAAARSPSRVHSQTTAQSPASSTATAKPQKSRRPLLVAAIVALALVTLTVWFFARSGSAAQAKVPAQSAENTHPGSTIDGERGPTPSSEMSGAGH